MQTLVANNTSMSLRKGIALAAAAQPIDAGKKVQDEVLAYLRGRMEQLLVDAGSMPEVGEAWVEILRWMGQGSGWMLGASMGTPVLIVGSHSRQTVRPQHTICPVAACPLLLASCTVRQNVGTTQRAP